MSIQNFSAGVSCWLMSTGAIIAWWWPEFLDFGDWQDHIGVIVIMEFLTLHSIGMLAGLLMVYEKYVRKDGSSLSKWVTLAGVTGLCGFYLSGVSFIADEVDNSALFIGFLVLIISRFIEFFGKVNLKTLMRDLMRSVYGFVLFFIGFFGTILTSDDLYVEGSLAVIAIYYFLLGHFEFKVPAEMPDEFMKGKYSH